MVMTASGVAMVPALTSTPSSVPARLNASSPTRSSQLRPGPSRGLRPAALCTIQAGWTASPRRGGRAEAHAPGAQLAEHGRERPAGLGQLVDGDRRGTREGALLDDALLLQTDQAVGEDVGADAGQPVGQVGEPLGPEQQLADDERCPALADRRRARSPQDSVGRSASCLRRYQRSQTVWKFLLVISLLSLVFCKYSDTVPHLWP